MSRSLQCSDREWRRLYAVLQSNNESDINNENNIDEVAAHSDDENDSNSENNEDDATICSAETNNDNDDDHVWLWSFSRNFQAFLSESGYQV